MARSQVGAIAFAGVSVGLLVGIGLWASLQEPATEAPATEAPATEAPATEANVPHGPATRVERSVQAAVTLDAPEADFRSAPLDRPCRIEGRVFGEDGSGREAVPLEGGLACGETVVVLASGASGVAGTYALEFEAPRAWEYCTRCRAFARVAGPGHTKRRAKDAVTRAGGTFRIDVPERAGGLLPGRVVDVSGAPIAGAIVGIYAPDERELQGEAVSAKDGTFELRFARSGLYDVHARKDGVGAAFTSRLALVAGVEHEPALELALLRPDAIAGRVVNSFDEPIARADVLVFPGHVAGLGEIALMEWRTRHDRLERDGVRTVRVKSDDAGRFHVKGLEPGNYLVVPASEIDSPLFAREVWSTGTGDVRLVIANHRLTITLREPDGAVATSGTAFAVMLCAGDVPANALLETGAVRSDGTARFEVRGGHVYVFGAFDSARGIVEDRVWIQREPADVRRELVLPEAGRPARFALTMLDYPDRRRRVHVATPSGVRLWSFRPAGPETWSLPAGTWRLAICDPPSHHPIDGIVFDEMPLFTGELALEGGETERLTLRF